MVRVFVFFAVLLASARSFAQTPSAPPVTTDYELWKWSDPEGSEPKRTTQDPGWWQRTFVGWDSNGDGRYLGGERGILILVIDWAFGLFLALGRYVLDLAISALPTAWKVDSSPLSSYCAIANTWIPLDYMLGLVAAYYAFLCVMIPLKMLLKVVRGA